MSRTKPSGKFHYELLYIVPNKFTQEEAKEVDNKVREGLAEHEADITYSEDWGNKKLAYPINHYTHGYYYLVEFDMPGERVNEMNYWLRMYENVMRYQIVKKRKRTREEIEEGKQQDQERKEAKEKEEEEGTTETLAASKSVASSKEASSAEDTKKQTEEKETKTEGSQQGSSEEKEKEEKKGKEDKEDLGDLDKKLDDILDSHDLL